MLTQLRQRIFLGLFASSIRVFSHAPAAEPAGTLEDYLQALGYRPVEFERTEHVQDFVEAKLNNRRKARLLVDTGWGITTLGKGAARGLKELNLDEARQYDPSFRSGSNTNIVLMEELALGSARFQKQPALVEEFHADYIQIPFEGVLGADFLFRNFCLIDCYKHLLYVRRGQPTTDQSKALEGTLRLSGFSETPLEPGNWPSVFVQINGKPLRLGVDTGAPYDELDDSALEPLGLKSHKYERPPTGSLIPKDLGANVVGMGQVGRRRVYFARAEAFQLGPRPWKNFDIGITDLSAWGLAKPGTRGEAIKGLLSEPTLHRQGTLIDLTGHKLWFRPQKPAAH